jgi:hypothetical protein
MLERAQNDWKNQALLGIGASTAGLNGMAAVHRTAKNLKPHAQILIAEEVPSRYLPGK